MLKCVIHGRDYHYNPGLNNVEQSFRSQTQVWQSATAQFSMHLCMATPPQSQHGFDMRDQQALGICLEAVMMVMPTNIYRQFMMDKTIERRSCV